MALGILSQNCSTCRGESWLPDQPEGFYQAKMPLARHSKSALVGNGAYEYKAMQHFAYLGGRATFLIGR